MTTNIHKYSGSYLTTACMQVLDVQMQPNRAYDIHSNMDEECIYEIVQ